MPRLAEELSCALSCAVSLREEDHQASSQTHTPMGYGQGRVSIPGNEGSKMSKDKGVKAVKKPAASTAKEKKAAKRDKNQAAASVLNNRK